MNPILLRYTGIALVAVIAGAGGGYLAVNNKKASPPPVTQSGTIPAIPAQTFPGQGIPAIPAIPGIPTSVEKPEPTNAPAISHILVHTIIRTGRANDVGAGQRVSIYGTNFSPKKNTVNWGDVPIVKNIESIYGNRTRIDFQVPEDAQPGSTHDITVTTPRGTSNEFEVRVVEYINEFPTYWGVRRPASGPVGTKMTISIRELISPYEYTSTEHYAMLVHRKFGAYVVIPTPLEGEIIGTSSGSRTVRYSVTIPKEAVYCPTFVLDFIEVFQNGVCSLGAPDTKVTLEPGEYWVIPYLIHKYPNSIHRGTLPNYGWDIFPEYFSKWFTITQ